MGIENNAFKRLLFNPSEGLALLTKMNQKNDITLGDYLTLITPAIMSYSEVIYIKGKVLKFVYKLSFLRGENDNNNDELTFVSNVDDKGANNISEYIARCDKNDYQLKLVSDPSSKIVIQNLKVDDEVLQKISIFYSKLQLGSFSELSIFLEQNFQNQITFIGMMNGVLVVKGNDETERCIYTSLTKEELTDGMKEIVESPMTRELQ